MHVPSVYGSYMRRAAACLTAPPAVKSPPKFDPSLTGPGPPRQVMLNPFHTPSTKITSKAFDAKVRQLAKRTLG